MEGRDGHVWLGLIFCIIGLWHLYNHIKNHATHKSYISVHWFPTSFARYLELYLTLIGCSIFSFTELHRQLWDHDGAILAIGLHHIEHACIAMAFFLHALFAILLDKMQPKPKDYIHMGHFLAALAFAQELLLFHFHSTDHMDLEGQYHWLLQEVVLICLVTTLLSIWMPRSFMVSYIRSLGVTLQGLWLVVMGFMLWTPSLAPKGCSLRKDHHAHDMVTKCHDQESLERGRALVNILFSCILIGVMVFGVGLYLIVNRAFGGSELREDGVEGEYQMEDKQAFFVKKGLHQLIWKICRVRHDGHS